MDTKKANGNKPHVFVANVHTEVNKPTHRYVCDACTGIADISGMPDAVVVITCKVCGKVQNCRKENWIAL